MQLPPINVILSWPKPNYINPTDVRGPQLLIITVIFFPIAVSMVALRVFTRLRLSKAFGIDDLILVAAIIPTCAIAVLTILAQKRWGWNRHIWDVPLDDVTRGLKLTVILEVLFGIAVSCTKLSLLIMTRRIMTKGTGILRHVAAVTIFIVGCEGFIFAIVVIFTCSPVSTYWTLSATPQKCINEKAHLLAGGVINTFTDFLVFFLPLPTVLALQMPRRQQAILSMLFGAGGIVCIAGIVRIIYAYKTTSTFDRTWESYPLWIASVLELYIGIICTSLPATKAFFTRYLPALIGSSILSADHSHSASQKPNSHLYSKELSLSSPSSPSIFESHELHNVTGSKVNTINDSRQLPPLSYPKETVKSPGFLRVYELGRGESRQGLVENVNRTS